MEEPDVRLIRLLVRFWILLALALTFERILVVANFIALVPPPDKACSQTHTVLLLGFPYVCPEPVLAKLSRLNHKWTRNRIRTVTSHDRRTILHQRKHHPAWFNVSRFGYLPRQAQDGEKGASRVPMW